MRKRTKRTNTNTMWQSYTIHKYNPYLQSLLNIVLNTYLNSQFIISHGSSLIFIHTMYLPACAFAVLGTFRYRWYRWYGWWCTNRVLVGIVEIQEIIAEFHVHRFRHGHGARSRKIGSLLQSNRSTGGAIRKVGPRTGFEHAQTNNPTKQTNVTTILQLIQSTVEMPQSQGRPLVLALNSDVASDDW